MLKAALGGFSALASRGCFDQQHLSDLLGAEPGSPEIKDSVDHFFSSPKKDALRKNIRFNSGDGQLGNCPKLRS